MNKLLVSISFAVAGSMVMTGCATSPNQFPSAADHFDQSQSVGVLPEKFYIDQLICAKDMIAHKHVLTPPMDSSKLKSCMQVLNRTDEGDRFLESILASGPGGDNSAVPRNFDHDIHAFRLLVEFYAGKGKEMAGKGNEMQRKACSFGDTLLILKPPSCD